MKMLGTLCRLNLRIFACAVLLSAAGMVTHACQPCLAEQSLTLEQTIKGADLIVVGYRMDTGKGAREDDQPQQIKVQAMRVLKGSVKENHLTVHSWSGMCPYGVVLADKAHYVLFLSGNGEFYNAVNRCSVKALRVADDQAETVTLDEYEKKTLPLATLLRDYIAPPEYKRALELLQYLKNSGSSSDALGGFDETLGGRWQVNELLSYISRDGLTTFDINDNITKRFSVGQLRTLLENKRNKTSTSFTHLGYIYAQPYPQYSTLSYEPQRNGIVVKMSGWYRLTFVREEGLLKLTKLEYLQVEGH